MNSKIGQVRDAEPIDIEVPLYLVVKNLPANAGATRDAVLIPGSGSSPGGGHDNPLQYSCLENPMGRGAWWAAVHGVTKSQTQLSNFPSGSVVKNSPTNARDIRDADSIPGSGSSPGGGHGNPLQNSCLENPKDGGARQAKVHRAAQSRTQLKQLSMRAHI